MGAAALRLCPTNPFPLARIRRDRARQIGAVLELMRPDEGGTCIRVVLPDSSGPHPMHPEQRSASPLLDGG